MKVIRPRWLPLAAMLILPCLPAASHGEPPSPINPDLFAFPGGTSIAGSARSAAVARADRWLGREPFDNPAIVPTSSVIVITPVLQRVSRQDLRAGNDNYDETTAFIDLLGAWIGGPVGPAAVALYAHQPVVRLEEFAFERGFEAIVPGVVQGQTTQREFRAGVSVSTALGGLQVGVGGEWTSRDDTYDTKETSGSPEAGTRHADFNGSAVGGQVGARYEGEAPWGGALTIGGAVRYRPALSVDGMQELNLLSGDSTETVSAERESGWEGGVSAAIPAGAAFRVLVSAGGRTSQEWKGFDVSDGSGGEWRVGGEFHDARDPWTLRFGLGQEYQTDVPESRAGVVGLGIGWDLEGTFVEFAATRRTLERADEPTSYEDRLVISARVTF